MTDAIRKLVEEMRSAAVNCSCTADNPCLLKYADELESALAAESPPDIESETDGPTKEALEKWQAALLEREQSVRELESRALKRCEIIALDAMATDKERSDWHAFAAKYGYRAAAGYRSESPDPERQARERLGKWLSTHAGYFYDVDLDGTFFLQHYEANIDADWSGTGRTWADACNAALDRAEGK